ncbi:unnamed protein product [Polarella glacialis]|uniref:Major facilitator superfamily (MFS) profile domain-containing protein n=1 Tax=Polarella glacialis TaxID=89957 RepID=A0A813INH4_POLGL|nr:unnamed protein product [Polarella glacialis]
MPSVSTSAIWTLYLIVFVDLFQLTFVFPFIPTIVSDFGGSATLIASQVAYLSSLAAIGEMIGAPILGALSDRYGRRPVLLVSTLGSAGSAMLLGYSKSFAMAAAARIVNGLSGGTAGIANTYLADVTSPGERPQYMSKMTAFIGIGLALGPIVGGALYTWGGVEVACLSAGAISLLNFVFIVFCLPESSAARASHGAATPLPGANSSPAVSTQSSGLPCKLWVLFAASVFQSPISVVFDTFANLYVTERFYDGDEKQGTILFSNCVATIGVCLLVVPLLLYTPFLKCVGFNASIVVGTIVIVAGLIGNGLASSPWVFLATTVVWAFGFQLMGPVVPVLISSLAPPSAMGRAFGLFQSFGNLSRVVGPTVLTPLYNLDHPSVFYFLGASISVVGCIFLFVSRSVSVAPPSVREVAASPGDEASESCRPAESETLLTRQVSGGTASSYQQFGAIPGQLDLLKSGGVPRLVRAQTAEGLLPDRPSLEQHRSMSIP